MANQTQIKFAYPDSVIATYDHWCVQLRPAQATLGALVMIATDEARQFHDLPPPAFAEMHRVISDIEQATRAFRTWNKINYLMLMMVDPDVHFHVLPRYDRPQEFAGTTFPDNGWPALPDLSSAPDIDDRLRSRLRREIADHWPDTGP